MPQPLERHVREIADDRALRLFGSTLAGVNAVTAVFWLTDQPIGRILARSTSPTVCWPFFESCYQWRLLDAAAIDFIVVGLLTGALCNAWLFVDRRRTAAGYWLLAAISFVKILLILQDYRLVLNQHYIGGLGHSRLPVCSRKAPCSALAARTLLHVGGFARAEC